MGIYRGGEMVYEKNFSSDRWDEFSPVSITS